MDAMVPKAEVERMIAAAVAAAVAEAVKAAVAAVEVPLREQLEEAKRTISSLLRQLFGESSERCAVVLTAAGQQFIDPQWLAGFEGGGKTPGLDGKEAPRSTRAPREQRGVAQRHPHLPIEESEAPVPEEIREQVEAGKLALKRSGRFDDALVVPPCKPLIRRVWEMAAVQPQSGELRLRLPLPERLVPGGVLADESIHHLVVAKFLDAIPFHRTLVIWGRGRIDIARQVVNDAWAAWAGVFAPLADEIIDQVLKAAVVHADESWARVQAKLRCERVNIWTVVGGGQVGYRYTADRTHARAAEIIPSGFTGYLITDAWQGWDTLKDIHQAGCNAHARRPFAKFADLTRGDETPNPDAKLILDLYAEVYRLEHLAQNGPPEALLDRRRRIRDEQTRKLMERIKVEAERIADAYSFKHDLAEGARYILNHHHALCVFLDNPLLPPDNNTAENALRINALIRKNSMFFGNDEAAKNGAVALTILHSCRLAGVEPHAYLDQVTPAMLQHRLGRRQDLASLTPLALAGSLQSRQTGSGRQ